MGAMRWYIASDLGIRGKAFPNSDTLELYQRLVRATVQWHATQRCSAERPLLLRCHLCAATCSCTPILARSPPCCL